jgi:hypothetical protein
LPNQTKSLVKKIRDRLDDLQRYDFIIYPNDHPPAHVHVEQAESVAIVELLPEVRIRESHDFNPFGLNEIIDLCVYFHEFILDKWDELHRKRL